MADSQVDFRLDIALLTKYFTGGRTAGRRECASRREAPLRFSWFHCADRRRNA